MKRYTTRCNIRISKCLHWLHFSRCLRMWRPNWKSYTIPRMCQRSQVLQEPNTWLGKKKCFGCQLWLSISYYGCFLLPIRPKRKSPMQIISNTVKSGLTTKCLLHEIQCRHHNHSFVPWLFSSFFFPLSLSFPLSTYIQTPNPVGFKIRSWWTSQYKATISPFAYNMIDPSCMSSSSHPPLSLSVLPLDRVYQTFFFLMALPQRIASWMICFG